jgi:hypothetical protein
MAVSTKGLDVWLYTADAVPVELVPTAISLANPPEVTVAASTGVVTGDVAHVNTVGFPELDNKTFVVGAVTATTIELLGADTTASTGVLSATPTITVYPSSDRVKLCLAQLDIAAPSANDISTNTFCEDGSVAGRTTPGTIALAGYLDENDTGLDELVKADEDGLPRYFEVVLPGTLGYLVGKITISGLSVTTPLDGAVGWTAVGTQNEKIKWVHA